MKGHPRIIEALNARLIDERTAIDQYYGHVATLRNWGFTALAAVLEERIADEEKHYNLLLDHIAFMEGIPTVGRTNAVNVAPGIPAMLVNDLNAELDAIYRYNETINLCLELNDAVTRSILEGIIKDERDHVDDQEKALVQIELVGLQNYLAQQI